MHIINESLIIDGKPLTRTFVHHPGAVGILPFVSKNTLCLIKQYRRAIDRVIIEIPAGILEKNETPLETAKRELQEEIGYKAKTFIPFGSFYNSPGFCDEYIHLFIAKDLTLSSLPSDDDEAIDTIEIKEDKVLELIEKGEIQDAKTLIALMRYFTWKKYGKI